MKTKTSSFGKAFLKPFCFAKAFTENTSWKKRFALVEIAVVLCSVFLVALPVTTIAAEQDDLVLDIYGNANEDDTIDMRDLTYVKLIFFGKKPETELADAKYDGKINPLDFIQIKLIIVGKEKELTLLDGLGKDVTVSKPVNRIIVLGSPQADAVRVLGAENNVVGIASVFAEEKILLPVMTKQPVVGYYSKPDYEAIVDIKPDIVITYVKYSPPELEEKLKPAGITVVRLDTNKLGTVVEDIKKLGYILDRRQEAEEFIDWHERLVEKIKDRTEGLSEDVKPRVYMEYIYKPNADNLRYKTYGKGSDPDQICRVAGGINIASDLPYSATVDPEWVIVQNPDVILVKTGSGLPSGYGIDDITGVKALKEVIMNLPELQEITAVKNENIYEVASDIKDGIQMGIATVYWAKLFHPDLFEDLDPEAIHKEYLDRFQRIDYNIDEHGVFAYPPIEIDDGLAGIPDKYREQI
jgi:iron complex transport system substrate-binding protein